MPATTLVYCAEGDTGNGFASYDIVTGAWVPLAPIPGAPHYGSAAGAFNGKVFVAGGTSGIVNTVDVYDVATNTWSAGTAAPNNFLLAGYQQVGQHLYVVGGFSSAGPAGGAATSVIHNGELREAPDANNATTLRLDMTSAPGAWSSGPAFTQGRADFGLAYDAGTNKLAGRQGRGRHRRPFCRHRIARPTRRASSEPGRSGALEASTERPSSSQPRSCAAPMVVPAVRHRRRPRQ
jgi:hypothetical protein